MKIMIRGYSEKEWNLVESVAYLQETELQQLLLESPSIIPLGDVKPDANPLVAAVREINLSVGYIDLLAFSAEGDIALIECKLTANPEVKRTVIGQILDYAAHLWEMSYDELDEIVRLRSGKNLAELVEQAVQSPEWEEEVFRKNVTESLANGHFILIIVVDEINEELARILSYVNTCGRPSFDFAALEMRRFQAENAEMLVPRVVGPVSTVKSRAAAEPGKQWDELSFFDELGLRHGDEAARIARSILEWAQNKVEVWWGKGRQTGSFVPYIYHKGIQHQLFAVYTLGVVETYFNWFARKPPFDAVEKRIELLNRLNQIQGVKIPDEGINKRPSIRLTTLAAGDALEQFLTIYDWVVEEILNS